MGVLNELRATQATLGNVERIFLSWGDSKTTENSRYARIMDRIEDKVCRVEEKEISVSSLIPTLQLGMVLQLTYSRGRFYGSMGTNGSDDSTRHKDWVEAGMTEHPIKRRPVKFRVSDETTIW